MATKALRNDERKRLRGIGHHLEPVVMIGEKGLTDAVLAEVERALTDHELIKLKINGEREQRQQIVTQLVATSQATVVQQVGKILLILRKNPKGSTTDSRLSNLKRFSDA